MCVHNYYSFFLRYNKENKIPQRSNSEDVQVRPTEVSYC